MIPTSTHTLITSGRRTHGVGLDAGAVRELAHLATASAGETPSVALAGVLQTSLQAFLQFSLLIGPLLILLGVALLVGWVVEAHLFPAALADAEMSGYWLGVTWLCLLLSLFSVTALVLQRPAGFWGVVVFLLVVAGVVQGAVLVRTLRKVGKALPWGLSRSLPPTAGPPRPDTGYLEGLVAKRSYKLHTVAAKLLATVAVGALTLLFTGSEIRTADAVFTVYVGLTTVDTLAWKLRRVYLEDNDPAMSTLAVLGLLCCILGATVVRLPDFFVPGSLGVRTALEAGVPYGSRLVEAYLTLPVYSWLLAIVQFVGVALGIVWASVRYWLLLESDADSTGRRRQSRLD